MDEIWCQINFDTLVSFDPNSYIYIYIYIYILNKSVFKLNNDLTWIDTLIIKKLRIGFLVTK
jgi:hypothetical protein